MNYRQRDKRYLVSEERLMRKSGENQYILVTVKLIFCHQLQSCATFPACMLWFNFYFGLKFSNQFTCNIHVYKYKKCRNTNFNEDHIFSILFSPVKLK